MSEKKKPRLGEESGHDGIRRIATFIDLTRLNDDQAKDDSDEVIKICKRARAYDVAAVCVFPQYVTLARDQLEGTRVKIATVQNFPSGNDDLSTVLEGIRTSRRYGADEVDVVIPYIKLIDGKVDECREFLLQVRRVATENNLVLKIIIESGMLVDARLISQAAQLCVEGKVDFIKTSTGKTKVSATREAAEVILKVIEPAREVCGMKVSGGIRKVEDAQMYLQLCEDVFGDKLSPKNFRIGASGLLDDIETRLAAVDGPKTDAVNSTY